MQTIDIREKDGTITQYVKDHNGVIKQLYPLRYTYDAQYVSIYDTAAYQAKSKALQLIRMGFVQSFVTDRPLTSLLDVGYGNGAFLKEAKNTVPLCSGYDITGLPVPTGCKKLDSIHGPVDVITFWDVLEHFPDLTFLQDLHECTDMIVVSLPWCHYLDYPCTNAWFTDWKHRKPNEHLHHFNVVSLRNTFKQFGWKMLGHSNIEDAVRTPVDHKKNILTAAFGK